MIRFKDFPYESKRSLGLFKYKVFFDAEYKIVGFNPQENNIDVLGTIQVSNGEIEFPVSPAFTNKEKDYMYRNQDEFIGKMATVIYQELEETGVPRFGVVKHIRAENDLGE